MAKRITKKAFAAIDTTNDHIASWTISGSAQYVRDQIGKVWLPSDPKEGWKEARIEGMRVVKVEIRTL
jgi:ribonuclease HI